MTLMFADADAVGAATTSIRAVALYATVVLGAMLSLFWRQEIGLYLLTVILPLQTTRYHLHAFPLGPNIVDIVLLCSIAGALMRPATPLTRHSAVPKFLVFTGLFYLLSTLRGTFFLDISIFRDSERFVDYKNIMVMPLLTLAAMLIIRTRRQIAIVLALCAVTAAAVDMSYLRESSGRDFGHYSEETRDAGPLGYAGENGLASYLVEITCCLIPLATLKRRVPLKAVLAAVICANVCCILFSYSREAYLALVAGLCFFAVLRMRWLLVPLVACGLLWQAILPLAVQERLTMTYSHNGDNTTGELDPSAQERVMLWTDAMSLFRENPIIGTGFLTYSRMNRVGSYKDTHNFYLKMLVETGVLGLGLFVLQLGLFFREGFLLFRREKDSFLSLVGLGFAGLILAASIVNLFGDRWLFIQVDSNLWILLGCVLAAPSSTAAESASGVSDIREAEAVAAPAMA